MTTTVATTFSALSDTIGEVRRSGERATAVFRRADGHATITPKPTPLLQLSFIEDDAPLVAAATRGGFDLLALVDREVVRVARVDAETFRLAMPATRQHPALAVTGDGRTSFVSRVTRDGLVPLIEVEGALRGGWWCGDAAVFGRDARAGGPVSIDVTRGVAAGLELPGDIIGAGGRVPTLVTADATGHVTATTLAGSRVALGRVDGEPDAARFSPDGSAAIRVQRGAASLFRLFDADWRHTTDVGGDFAGTSDFAYDGVRIRALTSTVLSPWRVRTLRVRGRGTAEHPNVVRFDLTTGSVEAVVREPAKVRGTVIALHGGPHHRWLNSHEPTLDALVSAGMRVIAPNLLGSTGYGEAYRNALDSRWAVDDLGQLTELAASLSRGRDGTALHLYGESYGGYLAAVAASQRPDLWRTAAMVSGFWDIDHLWKLAPADIRALLDRAGSGGPRICPERLAVPLLAIHGTHDRSIPFAHALRLAELSRDAPEPVALHPVAGGDHSLASRAAQREVTRVLRTWLQSSLPGRAVHRTARSIAEPHRCSRPTTVTARVAPG